MAFPSFFIIFIIIIFVIQHHLHKSQRIEDANKREFWQKEERSLSIRRKEFTKENYIYPSLAVYHFDDLYNLNPSDRMQFQQLAKDLIRLSKLEMMNFSTMTNSEIRLAFGTANQTIIQANEEHFDLFLKTLSKYGHLMLQNNYVEEATLAFEQCISLGSEYHDHYITLAEIYKNCHKKEAFNKLLKKASDIESINKNALIKKLNNYLF